MRITICFGGSIFGVIPNSKILMEIAKSLRELKEAGYDLLVVTGGGAISRRYMETARKFEVPSKILDKIGIEVTKLNARLLMAAIGDLSASDVSQSFEAAIRSMLRGKIPVMGGTTPGHTTDAVATELANSSKSDLLIFFTDVGGVYTKDPKKYDEAKKIDLMKASELVDLVSKTKFEPGISTIIDPLAAEILMGAQIRAHVLGSKEINRLPQIVEGCEHEGTVIEPN